MVVVRMKYALAVIATRDQMIQTTIDLNPRSSRYGCGLYQMYGYRRIERLTLFFSTLFFSILLALFFWHCRAAPTTALDYSALSVRR